MVNIKRMAIVSVLLVVVMLFPSCGYYSGNTGYNGNGYQQISSKKYDLLSIKKKKSVTKNVLGHIIDADILIDFWYKDTDGTVREEVWSQELNGGGRDDMIKTTLLSDDETVPFVVLTYSGENVIGYDFYLSKEMFQEFQEIED